MKHLLLTSLLFLSLCSLAQTNVYHPFSDSNFVWRENCGGYQSGCCADYQYTFTGDTLINNLIYKKLKEYGIRYPYPNNGFCNFNQYGQTNQYTYYEYNTAALREDTLEKKVYYYHFFNSEEVLLYDFDLNVGDTLPITLYNGPNMNYVSSIDSVLVGNSYRSAFHISSLEHSGNDSNYVTLIEGIGSTYGLLPWLLPPFESGTILICAKENNEDIYHNPEASFIDCEIITSIQPLSPPKFKVSPNPFKETAILEMEPTENTAIVLYDIFGETIRRYDNIGSRLAIERANLKSGIYFYQIERSGKPIGQGKLAAN